MNSIKIILFLLPMLLSACGGGGSSSLAENLDEEFIGSAGVGELVKFVVNTGNLKFKYNIIESQFGLGGTSKSGDLNANANGSYSQSTNPGSRLRISGDGLMFGTITETINANNINTVFYGSKNPSSSAVGIIGVYNFISRICTTDTFLCHGDYGTLKIEGNGRWTYCASANLTTDILANCLYYETGDYRWDGTYWRLKANNRANINDIGANPVVIATLVLTTRPAGNIITIDWKDNRTGYKIFGNGYSVGITQLSATTPTPSAVFDRIQDDGTYVTFNTDPAGRILYPVNPPALQDIGLPILNDPFTGFRRLASTGSLSLQLFGTGVYFSITPANGRTGVGFIVGN